MRDSMQRWTQIIAALRKIIASELPWEQIVERTSNRRGYSGIIFRAFQQMHLREAAENGPRSIQNALMNAYRVHSGNSIDHSYSRAKAEARGLLFDCVIDLYFPRAGDDADPLFEVLQRRQFLLNPESLFADRALADFLVAKVRCEGAAFFRQLAYEYEKLQGPMEVTVDVHGLVQKLAMARHWTDCDCPLWLMSRTAILQAGSTLFRDFPRTKWDREHLKYLLRDKGFVRYQFQPINEVRLDIEPQRGIVGFGIAKSIFSQMESKDFQFITSRWYHDSEHQVRRTRKRVGQLMKARGKLGRESAEYRELSLALQASIPKNNRQDFYVAYERSRRPR